MKQINVRLQDSEHDLIAKRAAEWGITPTEYTRLQALSPAADWRMRRVLVPKAAAQQFLDCEDDDLERLPNGWLKVPNTLQWFLVEDHPRGER